MIDALLPRQIDMTYRGHRSAPWILIVIVSVRIAQSLVILLGGRYAVILAHAVPLDTYDDAIAQTMVFAFAGWKVERLLIALLSLLVVDRYRSLIPLMFVLFILQDFGRRLIADLYAGANTGSPGVATVNLVLLTLALIGLPLSLWQQGRASERVAERAA